MTTRKRQRRQESTAEEYSLGVARAGELRAIAAVQDADLFVVDRAGSKTAKRKIAAQEQQSAAGVVVSRTERKLIRRRAQLEKTEDAPKAADAPSDIWGAESDLPSAQRFALNQRAKRAVIRPGQSYNPNAADHQDLLAEVS